MKKRAFAYLARVGVQKGIGFLLYIVGTGFSITCAGALYFAYLFLATLVIGWILFRANEKTLAERGKTDTDSPMWDKVLLLLFWLLNYFVVYLLAGLAETGEHTDLLLFLGMALTFAAAWFSTRATLENTFLESTARIQSDRGQIVCTTGPYRIVRHPAYSGLLLNAIGISMIFPYVPVWICMAVTAVLIILRTALEDKMLKEGLEGYRDYTRKTKYRLLPFIW